MIVFKLYYVRCTFRIILDAMDVDPKLDLVNCWNSFNTRDCMWIKSVDELKQSTLFSCWKNCIELTVCKVDET